MTVVLSRKPGGSGGGGAPSGPAGGDLAGTYPDPTLAAGAVLFNAYALLRDQQAAGTAGGGFTNGAWRTRVLNTEVTDTQGIVSLSSNQFTLQAGSYLIRARAQAYRVERNQMKIRNITGSTDLLTGPGAFTANVTSASVTDATVQGVITLAGATVLELQHICQTTFTTSNWGMGIEANLGVPEVYAEVEIFRLA